MDDFSFNLLKVFSSRSSLSLLQLEAILDCNIFSLAEPINYLREKKYLQIEPNYALLKKMDEHSPISPNTPLVITFLGKVALENEAKERTRFKFNELRSWITLAIAILAFILSVISLILQQC